MNHRTALVLDPAARIWPISLSAAAPILAKHHYLGPSRRGFVLESEEGILVFANPSSRRLPQERWLELVRWCLFERQPNAGSRQWKKAREWMLQHRPEISTIVSYSDPAAGHTGALYRSCNWGWAPTWHRLRPPPTGNGDWGSGRQETKDRWVDPLREDAERQALLALRDAALLRRMPWAEWREPRRKRGSLVIGSGGGDFKRWIGQRIELVEKGLLP